MRPIDADALLKKTINNPLHAPYITEKDIKEMPTIQPERKKGKWIRNDNGTYSCSLCHSWIPEEQYYYAQFCLYCGADMKGEQE